MGQGWWAKLTEDEKVEIRKIKSEQYWKAREKVGYIERKGRKLTLCWSCQRAVKECPWSANFEPVDGWDAVPTKIMGPVGPIPSFHVKSCPLYEPDPE